ncbi:methanobactin export MATE transporter MbnM [Malikia granosa]|nr:methanobactin export MATE transporter MbnM [Malikia granosa]
MKRARDMTAAPDRLPPGGGRTGWLGRLALASLVAGLAACGGGGRSELEVLPQAADRWSWVLPSGFPVPKEPETNPMSTAKVELGRHLFYDRRLSGNGSQSCASCHLQHKAFTDGLALAQGSTGQFHRRGAQPLANVAYNATLTWANPSLVTLEKQIEVPLFGDDPVEMGVNDSNQAQVLARIAGDPAYPQRFAQAFPGQPDPVSWAHVIQSIAAFQRSLISGNSRYDQYTRGQAQLTAAEERGLRLFFGDKAECFHCHGSFNFNDQVVHASSRFVETPFHNTGLYNLGDRGDFPALNQGLFEFTAQATDRGRFRAQTLRNIEVTAPYMHDGSLATLEEVVDFYAAGGRQISSGPLAGDGRKHPNKSDQIAPIDLDAQEKADLVAFLKTLTDHEFLANPKFADPFSPP